MTFEFLSDIFFDNCEKFSENCAIIHNTGECVKYCTYKELCVECCKVTQCLREVCAEGFIGIFMEQDLTLPAIILGILHSNLPFICIDIQDSEERVLYLLRHLSIKWVFTKNNIIQAKKVLEKYGMTVRTLLLYEDDYSLWHININFLTENKFAKVPSSLKLAYAIQTSGSTGKPKMIFVPHQCILPNILDISLLLQIQQNDLIFLTSPLTFDPSIVELFIPFTCGAALLIVPSSIRALPSVLLDVLFPVDNEIYSGVTILQITPSVFSRWSVSDIQNRILNRTATLKKLVLGGEPCPSMTVLNCWKSVGNKTEIFNIYGITEISCWATVNRINFSSYLNVSGQGHTYERSISDVPLGSSFSKTLLEVRNCEGNKILDGEGELYIGSSERICLVDEEAFHQLPIPLFRATGDIVKVNKRSNNIVFLGRKNRIIKRWGHQVCLNRVETVLSNHKDVETCACVWDQERNVLGIAVIWKIENTQSFRLYCISQLHKSEVPDKVVKVKSLPLTKHGKVNYEELKYIILENDDLTKYSDGKVTLSEQILCAWKSVLGQEPPLSENFISSGGNSFLAIQLTAELEKIFGDGIRNKVMNMLFNNSSVLEIMNHLLGNDLEGETQIEDNMNSVNTSILNSTIVSTSAENKPLIRVGELNSNNIDPSSEDTFMDELAPSARRRKLHCDELQSSKRGKTEIPTETICSVSKDNFSAIQNEDPLIKVSCRGMVFQREALVDSSIFKYGEKIDFHFNWKYDMHKCVDASPCYLKFAKKNWVAIGSHSHLLVVLECSSGKMVSKCKLPDRIESSICPSFCGKYGIVGCYDGCVYCISLLDGGIKWSFRTGAMVKSTPALCLENTGVVVGSYDKNTYCISVEDGKLIWKNSPSSASIFASPCISSSSMVYIATLNGTCVSLCERTGQLQWKTKVSSPVFSSPALVHSSKGIIFSEVVGIVHCFSASNGDKIWQFKANGEIFSSLSTLCPSSNHYELLVFGSHDRHVYCLKWNHNDNEPIINWKQEVDSSVYSTPFLYEVESLNTSSTSSLNQPIPMLVMVASTKGVLYILNGDDGSIECSKMLTHEVFSSPIVCEGHVIIGSRDNFVYNFTLLPEGY